MGPWSYAKHLVSGPRLPFSAAYFGSIGLTLYFAIGVRTIIPCRSFSTTSIDLLLSIDLPIFPKKLHYTSGKGIFHTSSILQEA